MDKDIYSMNCPICDTAAWLIGGDLFKVDKIDAALDAKTVTVLLVLHMCRQ